MTAAIHLPSLPFFHWVLYFFSALVIGLAKSGLTGLGVISIPIMAVIFGGKASSGLILPLLVMADTLSVFYYNRHADWTPIWKLLPATIAGTLIGVWVGDSIDDELFKDLIGVFILGSIVLMLVQERGGLPPVVTQSRLFASFFGLLGGFSSMIGNAAGPFLTVYLLSLRLPKNNFISTSIWFFLLINLFKVPLHLFFWKTITLSGFALNLLALPVIALGVFTGFHLVKYLPEKTYRYMVIGMTVLLALGLLFE